MREIQAVRNTYAFLRELPLFILLTQLLLNNNFINKQ